MFARNGRPTPLGQAFAEYGRIDKTLHLLSILDPIDDTHRRKLNKQLTVQESRHRLARKICHGAGGQIRPLGHAHLNVLGRYSISSSTPAEGLRQLGEIPDLPDFPHSDDLEEKGA